MSNAICSICGHKTKPFYDHKFDINYYYCEKCQFIKADEYKHITFQREREIYEYHNNSLECEGYVNMFKDFIQKAILSFEKNGHMLDFGSGPNPVFSKIIKRDYKYAIDIYDIHYSPIKIYEDKCYDIIASCEVLEHLKNPHETISTIYKHLKPGGIFAFMTLLHNNSLDQFLKWWYRRDETHISFYSKKTIEYIADIFGFKIIYFDNKRICTLRKIMK